MGKAGELWDDSALISAYDNAISTYKRMHRIGEGEVTDDNPKESLSDAEANYEDTELFSDTEHLQDADKINTTMASAERVVESVDFFQMNGNSPFGSSTKHVEPSCNQNGKLGPNHDMKSSSSPKHIALPEVRRKDEAALYSTGQEEYNQLLNKYYDIDYQRQNILQQLNHYCNYQNPSTSASEHYQASPPGPYPAVSCCCSYGCQNWVVPCDSLPASCSGATCIHENRNTISKGADGSSMSRGDSDVVKTAMDAAHKAMSSLQLEGPCNLYRLANEVIPGKDNEVGIGMSHVKESSKDTTDLAVVLNAWYSAGFYTGNVGIFRSRPLKTESMAELEAHESPLLFLWWGPGWDILRKTARRSFVPVASSNEVDVIVVKIMES